MDSYPRKSPVDQSNPLVGFQNVQPTQVFPSNNNVVKSGQDLLKTNAPGMMNENRFTSLKPSRQSK